jgi:hypothetical protein
MPERAARAGLELVNAVAQLERCTPLPGVAIAAGLVMAGELIGGGATQERFSVP